MGDVPQAVLDLIEKFDRNIDEYKNPQYNETMIRVEFVNPLFKALGWDVYNEKDHAPAYREVIHEDAVKVAGATKAPDYSFRIGETRKFFVETKKPSVNLKDDPAPAFQLRRYAYSARLPISILTDFEEFIVYGCRTKPSIKDKPSADRIKYYTFRDYAEKWDEISSVFHREAILRGSFDKYAQSTRGKRGTAEIDKDFLADLDRWRLALAQNFALRNPSLTVQELNFAVQMTIDRLIFLRMCEDRGIENYGQLEALVNGVRIYPRLVEVYRKADERYNSGLFHFTSQKGDASHPDILTPELSLDDKVLKEIIRNLYYPKCPYEFSLLPVEVLGNAYEQFLGKTIRLTAGHQAKIEEKPEVRKAGGVYYTPEYIVTYIVKNTVGKLLEGKTPKDVADIRILDPACGSGSFLLGAYRCLLDWHLGWYKGEKERTGKLPTVPPPRGKRKRKNDPDAIFQGQGGDWLLTTAEKKRILLNNIHGVDIDQQAVEVTKLSLLLRVLEDENQDTLNRQLTLWRERALPDLGNNIKCGNSLIGPDFYDGQMFPDEEELHRFNPFDWKVEFSEVFKAGGFDAVIGNPPYVRPHNIPKEIKEFLWTIYSTFVAKSDMYSCFMEKGLTLIKPHGLFSFIVPQTWTSLESFTKIREFFVHNGNILKLVQLPQKVFADATVETCIFIVEKKMPNDDKKHIVFVDKIEIGGNSSPVRQFSQKEIETAYLYNFQLYGQNDGTAIIEKILTDREPLSDFVKLVYGFKTGDDKQFIHPEKKFDESEPFIRSAGIHRYWTERPTEYVWYVPQKMINNRKTARPGEKARFEAEKIIVARMGKTLAASYDIGGLFVKDAMLLLAKSKIPSMKYLLGIINSRLLTYYYQGFFVTIDVLKNALLSLPIAYIDFNVPSEKLIHDNIVKLVDQMLALHKELPAAITDHEQTLIRRRIDAADRQIDQLVYELYELTEDEIRIVEGS